MFLYSGRPGFLVYEEEEVGINQQVNVCLFLSFATSIYTGENRKTIHSPAASQSKTPLWPSPPPVVNELAPIRGTAPADSQSNKIWFLCVSGKKSTRIPFMIYFHGIRCPVLCCIYSLIRKPLSQCYLENASSKVFLFYKDYMQQNAVGYSHDNF